MIRFRSNDVANMNNKGFYRFSWNWNIVTPILRKNNKNRIDQMRKFSGEIYFSFQRRTFVSHTYILTHNQVCAKKIHFRL